MKAATVLVALAVVAISGCLTPSSEPPLEPLDQVDPPELQRIHWWNTTHQGDLGLRLLIETYTRCSASMFMRGLSDQYEPIAHMAYRGDITWPTEFWAKMETSAPGAFLGDPRIHASVAGAGGGVDMAFEPEWVRYIDGRGFNFMGEGILFMAFKGLHPAPEPDRIFNITAPSEWLPEPDVTASWRLECDEPAQVIVEAVTERVHLMDDLTLHGDGFHASVSEPQGWRHGVVASTGFDVSIEGELTFFGDLPPDPQKIIHLTLTGPGVDREWITPPTTYILQIGDVAAYAEGPAGTYRIDWTQVGAGPFIIFEAAIYDFDAS